MAKVATIGLLYPVFAALATEPAQSAPTYSTGMVVAEAISCNVSFNHNSAELYADNALVASDNSITGGTLSLNSTMLEDTVRVAMLGDVASSDEYSETSAPAPYGGFGYIRNGVNKDGTEFYTAYWLPKTQWSIGSDDANTKGANAEFSTPTMDGKIMGVFPDNTGKAQYRVRQTFTAFAAAQTWLKTKAGNMT